MEFGLKGKTALVAASSRGLGRAVADELAKEGANLVICARTVGPLEEAGQWIHDATGVEVVAVPADLSVPEDIDRLMKTAEEDFGKIDILVTNTGGPPPGPFESHSVEAWSTAVEQNLNSVLNLTRAVLLQGPSRAQFGHEALGERGTGSRVFVLEEDVHVLPTLIRDDSCPAGELVRLVGLSAET